MILIDPVLQTKVYEVKAWTVPKKGVRKTLVAEIRVVSGSSPRAVALVRDYLRKHGIHYDNMSIKEVRE